MVGRVDSKHAHQPYYTYIIGSNMLSREMHDLHERVAAKYSPEIDLDYEFNSEDDPNRFYYRSDHYNFAKHKVPVIFYFNGTHSDYHKPGDDVEKIHFDKLTSVTKLIFHTTWELANADKRPALN
jgi:Zn-dependent M28 family amino/carboxypeptidase